MELPQKHVRLRVAQQAVTPQLAIRAVGREVVTVLGQVPEDVPWLPALDEIEAAYEVTTAITNNLHMPHDESAAKTLQRFQLAYGAGPRLYAETLGEDTEKIIKTIHGSNAD